MAGGYPCVYQDDYYASYMITEKLLEKGQNAAYIGVTDRDEAVGAKRSKGFEAALPEKVPVVPERMKIGNFTMESGYECAKELCSRPPLIDSLICATDTMAVGQLPV